MSYFKPSPATHLRKAVARPQALTWVLIYGGLLTLVLGLWVTPADDDTGWLLVAGGGLAAAVGVVLIYVRSRIKDDS